MRTTPGARGRPSSSAISGAERLESASATNRELKAIVVAWPSTVASTRPVLSPTSAAFAEITRGGALEGSAWDPRKFAAPRAKVQGVRGAFRNPFRGRAVFALLGVGVAGRGCV